mgnify:CR=1 FL=1
MKKSDVIQHFGSQAEIANAMTIAGYPISQPAVSKWPELVPPLRAFQLERMTSGALVAEESSSPQQAA